MTVKEFKEYVLEWAQTIGVKPQEIHIRRMKHKWGSASSKGRLTFNTEILEQSERKRKEYVLHEILHLKYPNHGKMFNTMLKYYLTNRNSI